MSYNFLKNKTLYVYKFSVYILPFFKRLQLEIYICSFCLFVHWKNQRNKDELFLDFLPHIFSHYFLTGNGGTFYLFFII
jgi:hypothetical protein